MIEIPKKIPHLPEKEELKFKEKELMLTLYEQFQQTSRYYYIVFLAVVILALPLGFGIRTLTSRALINSYQPPLVNPSPLEPEPLQVLRAETIQVLPDVYSAYAQVLNPNPELTAWEVNYEMTFEKAGRVLGSVQKTDFILSGSSKFLVVPSIRLSDAPDEVELKFGKIRWTGQPPRLELGFDVVQQTSGVTEEGNFFVQAVVRNNSGFRIKTVRVDVLVFDRSNENLVALNSTELSDLESLEGRFFRTLWPEPILNVGQIQVTPQVNPYDLELALEQEEQLQFR